MPTAIVFATTASLYTLASACFFAFVSRRGEPFRRFAVGSLAAAVVAHLAFVALDLAVGAPQEHPVWRGLAAISVVPSVVYLAWSRKQRYDVLGVFIAPIALILFLGASLGSPGAAVSHGLRSAVLPLHVGANLLGIVLFSLAFTASVAFLIQDRLLRQKKLHGLFRRLPSLEELDRSGFRLLTSGFAFFTLGVVSGTVFVVKATPGTLGLDASRIAAFVAWTLFAAVLFARLAIGFRGRRAAFVTIAGFALTMITLFAYVLRGDGG